MRTKTYILSLLVLISFSVISCGGGGGDGDDTPTLTPEEQRIAAIAGANGTTWVATSITFDGAPATGFENFSLTLRGTLTSKTYTSADGDPLFGASGTWDFNGTNLDQIIVDNNTNNVFTVSNLNTTATPNTVRLSVNFTADGGAAAGTSGLYVLNLQKQ
ncbi:lipocalin family protein [Roseivirga sp. E12]|uniref:lipocalin family protein n=1 Tax=Roseivirga sp. E12 TaxID=2819237 RepID=UPI001ABCA3C7|nr:lipocalin family protein [Roseivirga sp. E12]MBO3698661.1 lipocalin family protein [Roseivirga sp. E12]